MIKVLRIAQRTLILLSAMFVCTVLFLVTHNQREKGLNFGEAPLQQEELSVSKPLHLEGLASPGSYESFYGQDVARALIYLGKNSRPDAEIGRVQCLVGLEGSHQTMLVEPFQKLYLSYGKEGLKFSQKSEPLWIKFKEIQSETLQYDAGVLLEQEETDEVYQEKVQGVVTHRMVSFFEQEAMEEPYLQSFENVKWWRPDLFYEAYGGVEFRQIKGHHRLEFDMIDGREGKVICYVEPNTQLIFKDHKWEVSTQGIATTSYPMAQILSITPVHMEIKVWDVSGIHTKQLSLTPQRTRPLNIKAEEVFLQIRQRTARQVVCKVGGKNLLLKQGDWLLHTGTDWKLLKTLEEIENYVSLRLEGELFVFEGVEKNQGNTIFKGQLFDTMREQMQAVRIPIAAAKNKRLTKRPREEKKSLHKAAVVPQINRDSLQVEAETEEELLRLANPQKRHDFSK